MEELIIKIILNKLETAISERAKLEHEAKLHKFKVDSLTTENDRLLGSRDAQERLKERAEANGELLRESVEDLKSQLQESDNNNAVLLRDVKTQKVLVEKWRKLSNSLTVKVDELKKENKILDSHIKGDFFPVAQPSLCESCSLNEGNSVNVKCPQPAHALCEITIVEECDGYKEKQPLLNYCVSEDSKDSKANQKLSSLCDTCNLKDEDIIEPACPNPKWAISTGGAVGACSGYRTKEKQCKH